METGRRWGRRPGFLLVLGLAAGAGHGAPPSPEEALKGVLAAARLADARRLAQRPRAGGGRMAAGLATPDGSAKNPTLPRAVWAPGGAQPGSPALPPRVRPGTPAVLPPAAPVPRPPAAPLAPAAAPVPAGDYVPLSAGPPPPAGAARDRAAESRLRKDAFLRPPRVKPPEPGRLLLAQADDAATRARIRAAEAAAAARAAAGAGGGAAPAAGGGAGLRYDPTEMVNVDFKDVDVKTILRFLAEKTRTNYFMDPGIAAKINVIGPNEVPLGEAVLFLESAIEDRGFTVEDSGTFKQVIPRKDALKQDIEMRFAPVPPPASKLAQERTVTEIIEIVHAPVEEIQAAITPLLSGQTPPVVHKQTNKIILTETIRTLERVRRVIQELDVPIRGKQVHMLPIRYRKADDIAKAITDILTKEEFEKLVPQTKQEEAIKPALLSDPAQNLLVVVAVRRDLEKIQKLVRRLDVDPSAGPPVEFIELEYAEPAAIVEKVKAAFQLPGQEAKPGFTLVPDERTQTLMLRSVSENLSETVKEVIRRLDRRAGGLDGARVRVYRMQFAEAEKVAEILGQIDFIGDQKGAAAAQGSAATTDDKVQIVADPNTNSLVITAPRGLFERIEAVIRELDQVKPQVLVEVLIAEVDYNWARGMGLDFNFLNESSSSTNRPFAVGNNDVIESFISQSGVANGLNLGLFHGQNVDLGSIGTGDIGELSKIAVLTRLFQNTSHANILSSPVLMTSDNETARIAIGERIQIPASFATAANTGLNTVTSFNSEDLGVILEMTPRITMNDHVVLKVNQQIKARTGDLLGSLGTPVISNREVDTRINVRNGDTIVIGGLISEEETRSENKLPILGDIPGIGNLFRSRSRTKNKTNLLIFLTPHITRDANGTQALTKVARDDLAEEIDRSGASRGSQIRKDFRGDRTFGKFRPPERSKADYTTTGSGEGRPDHLRSMVRRLREKHRRLGLRPSAPGGGTGDGRFQVDVGLGAGGSGEGTEHPGFEVDGL